MNLDNLQRNLIAAARTAQPSEAVPYAFEKRIMARLARGARVDLLGAWSAALWRGAMSCVAVVVISGACSMFFAQNNLSSDLSQELETAVFASADPAEAAQ